MLNCLRVLQRVLPVVFEVEGEASVFELEVLWKRQQVDQDLDEGTPQFVIEDEDDSEDEARTSPPKQTKMMPSLGEKLFSCITDLLFCCGFTLPTKIQVDHHKINYVIWYVVSFPLFFVLPLNHAKGKRRWVDDGPRSQQPV